MRRKIQFIFSIVSFSIALIFLSMGVYAAATAKVSTINGSVSFTSDNVLSTVTVYSLDEPQAAPINVASVTGTQRGQMKFVTEGQTHSPIAIPNAPFTDSKINYAIVITVKNDFASGGRSIEVTIPKAPNMSALSITTARYIDGVSNNVDTTRIITPGTTIKFVFTFSINVESAPNFNSTQGAMSLQFELSRL